MVFHSLNIFKKAAYYVSNDVIGSSLPKLSYKDRLILSGGQVEPSMRRWERVYSHKLRLYFDFSLVVAVATISSSVYRCT